MKRVIDFVVVLFVAIRCCVFGEILTTEYLMLSSNTVGVEAIKEDNNDIIVFVNKNYKKDDTVLIGIRDIVDDEWELVSPNSGNLLLNIGDSITYEARCNVGNEDNKVGTIYIKEFEVVFHVYVDQPLNGTDKTHVNVGGVINYGHVFWELEISPENFVEKLIPLEIRRFINISAGYYPSLNLSYPQYECPGKFEMPDTQHPKEITYEQGITLNNCIEGLEKMQFIESNPGIYNAKTHNCVHVAREVGDAVNVDLPDGKTMVVNGVYIPNAGKFGMQILEMKGE